MDYCGCFAVEILKDARSVEESRCRRVKARGDLASIMSSLRTIDIFLQLQMKFVHVNIIIGSLLIGSTPQSKTTAAPKYAHPVRLT